MKKILFLILVLSFLTSGCVWSRYWERRDAQTISEDQFRKDFKECFGPCYYSSHWKSLSRSWIPIYGGIYQMIHQDEENKATDECFDSCIKEKGYQRRAASVR